MDYENFCTVLDPSGGMFLACIFVAFGFIVGNLVEVKYFSKIKSKFLKIR